MNWFFMESLQTINAANSDWKSAQLHQEMMGTLQKLQTDSRSENEAAHDCQSRWANRMLGPAHVQSAPSLQETPPETTQLLQLCLMLCLNWAVPLVASPCLLRLAAYNVHPMPWKERKLLLLKLLKWTDLNLNIHVTNAYSDQNYKTTCLFKKSQTAGAGDALKFPRTLVKNYADPPTHPFCTHTHVPTHSMSEKEYPPPHPPPITCMDFT